MLIGCDRYQVYVRLQRCVRTIARHCGVEDKIFHLNDGTAWFGDEDSNPDDLDRNGIYQLCRERLKMMRLKCNKKWPTIDTEETLYAEIMFQHCISLTTKPELAGLKQKYGDRLRLPLTSFINSPTKFSIAHRVHGSGMFSGWPTTTPSNGQERLNNDYTNNMLVESWYVNCAKQDMAEDYYSLLDRILRSANAVSYTHLTLPTKRIV